MSLFAGECFESSASRSPGVSTSTGHTALTLIPLGPSSLHKLCVKPVTPNLVAEYALLLGVPLFAARLDILIIEPPSLSAVSAACAPQK